ncbi:MULTISPECIES: hypothetical protein [Trichocoleus]|uniref:Uncharacterized protein n=1 Tax=Trichocoleus desertorum GB2-A4 TaxID=2933944 RepID=A0ABV0JFX0_9CYAN|nr:hypothetical protein [Trichocoleus sp. FACHB-46]MBD1863025.1 hypothetical protein [Trichocoleus sp. FACHB-46]
MGKIFDDATPEQERKFIEEHRKEAFLAACQWPLSWLLPARRHKRAADALFEIAYTAYDRDTVQWLADGGPFGKQGARKKEGKELANHYDMELLGDYFLLAGYALECVLKGCLMAMRPGVEINDRLDKLVITHDLIRLCRDCSISLSSEEGELLAVITRYIIWGKYAGPRDLKDMPSPVNPDNQNSKSLRVANPFHERRVQVLVDGVFQRGHDLINTLGAPGE